MTGARRARLVSLGAAGMLASLTLLLVGQGAPVSAAPSGPPCVPQPDCLTTTTTLPTTSSTEDTTTTVDTTTTTAPTTTTTFATTSTTRRVVTTTSPPLDVSTSVDVLVPGDGTEGAESTTTTTHTPTTISNDGTSDGALLALIVGGLLVIASAVSILTWRYWVATRPALAATVGSEHG